MAKRKTTTPPAVTTSTETEQLVQPTETQQVSGESATQAAPGVYSRFTDFDIHLFRSGKHYKLYEKFGSHVVEHNGVIGTYFAVWAPSAKFINTLLSTKADVN